MNINIPKQMNSEIIGFLMLIGSLQFIMSILIGSDLAINYNSELNYVSTLGAGSTAFLFSFSVFILGISLLACSYFLQKVYREKIPTILLVLTGISACGVGLFPYTVRPFHGIFTGLVFIFASIFLVSVIKISRSPFLILISCIGALTLITTLVFFPYLGLEVENNTRFLGLLKGTLERIVIYLNITPFICLGGYLGRSEVGKVGD